MGSLSLPPSGLVYIDTQILIYSVERHPKYEPFLAPLWSALRERILEVAISELAWIEALVAPIRNNDRQLQADYEQALLGTEIRLLPITRSVLDEAARLRARIGSLRTPDAIHAASATLSGCVGFLTNDVGFRRVTGLNVMILDEALV